MKRRGKYKSDNSQLPWYFAGLVMCLAARVYVYIRMATSLNNCSTFRSIFTKIPEEIQVLPEPCIDHFLSIFSYSHLLDWVRKLKLIGHIKGKLKYIPI